MANPTTQIVTGHVQDYSLQYGNQQFIWNEVAAPLDMPSAKAKITTYNRGDMFRDEAVLRAPGAVTPWGKLSTSDQTLTTNQYAHKEAVTKEQLNEIDRSSALSPPLDMKMDSVKINMDKINLKNELLVASAITGATLGDGNVGGEDADAKWVSSSGNTFLADVDNGINTLRQGGCPLNKIRLMMDFETWQGVRINSAIASRTQYTKDEYPSVESMARYLNIDKVVVAGGIYSTAKKLAAETDFTTADIWGGSNDKGYALVYAYEPRPTLRTMALAVTGFHKMENGQRLATYEWYEKSAHSWFYETQAQPGIKVVSTVAGYAWKDTHTT